MRSPHAWARTRIAAFLAGWQEPGGAHGATLAIRKSGVLVGFVYVSLWCPGYGASEAIFDSYFLSGKRAYTGLLS